ncbi:MAG TPA: MFS transporter [Blastocatellia bacterium]|jgi:predicted MFS family arabinose efflux permease
MADVEKAETPSGLTGMQWLICIVAAIGFAFDTYELLMLPLVLRPAIETLGGIPFGTPEFGQWRDLFFYVPAVCGGVFGLLGGYLTDRFGRRRVLVWSILVYAFSALAAGFSTSLEMLLILRCTTFIGVCVEFVAAVAWLAELFPDPKRREQVLGYTQAFSSLGGLMVSGAFVLAATYANSLPAINGAHEAWRYTLISGVIPAIPLIIIRPFLPESPIWKRKKMEGTLKRPSLAQLFRPEFKRTTLITTLMVAASFAVAFGAIQHLPQIVPGLPEVRGLEPAARQATVGTVQLIQEIGGLAGRFFLAFLAVRIVSRRKLIRIFQAPGLVIVPLVFIFAATSDLTLLKFGIFVAGFLTVAQFSFWGNYLPRVFPTHLRGTGESFSANVGGRMFGTSAALLTTQLAATMPGASAATHLAYAAAAVAFLAFGIGLVASFWLPEPKQEELPE